MAFYYGGGFIIRKKLSLILVLLFVVFSVSQCTSLCEEKTGSTAQYHEPIFIDGDENFTAENGVSGGNGTPENPYVIEGFFLKATDQTPAIHVRSNLAIWVIRNITIEGSENSTAMIIFRANDTGVPCSILHVKIKNAGVGCRIEGKRIEITHSRFEDVCQGIHIFDATNITISNNYFLRRSPSVNYSSAIYCESFGKYIYVTNNVVYSSQALLAPGGFFYSRSGYHIVISGNRIDSCSSGIYLYLTASVFISNDTITNTKYGIVTIYGGGGYISGEIIVNCEVGIVSSMWAWNGEIRNSLFMNCSKAISFDDEFSSECVIHHCTFISPMIGGYVEDCGINYWNTTNAGNYWSDWHEPDANHDGIVDNPYPIYDFTGNITTYDYYPLTKPPAVFILHTPVLDALTNQDVVFNASVLAYENLSAVKLLYKLRNESTYKAVSMHFVNQDGMLRNYTCSLTMPVFPAEVEYYLYAEDIYGKNDTTPVYTINVQGVPSSPRNLSAVPGNKVVHLTWETPVSDGNGNITEYRVYRGIASGSETLYASVNASTLNFTDTNVSNGVAYYYYVTAVNELGESEPSNEVSAVPCAVPSPPRNLTAIAGNASVTLSWEPPADDGGMAVTNYTIYYGTISVNYTMNMTVGNITSYTITGLTNGQRYYFAVSAINEVGESEKSNEVSAVPCTVPSAPQNLTAVAGNRNVTLTWEPPADNGSMSVTNYTVYYGTTPGNYTNNITVGNITSYTITGLINGQRYYFAVSAFNAVGESEKSNEVSAVPCTVPSAPQNLTAVAGNGNVTLTWQPPADNGGSPITGYRIYYGTSAGNYTVNITVGNVTAYTITNLTNGQKYYFSVSAINGGGEGAKSNEVSATPIAEPNPTPGFDVIAYIYAGVVCIGIIMLGRKKRR